MIKPPNGNSVSHNMYKLINQLLNSLTTRNAEHGTQNTERGTRNAEHETQNTKRGTQNTEH